MRLSFTLFLLTILGCSKPVEVKSPPSSPDSSENHVVKPDDSTSAQAANQAKTAFLLGRKWADQDDHEKAILNYSEAIRLDPTFAPAFNSRGLSWLHKGNAAQAIQDYSEAIRLEPNMFYPYINRGNAFRKIKELHKAIADFSAAIALAPERFEPWDARANAWCQTGDHEKGIKDFDAALKLNSAHGPALRGRAAAWERLGNYDKAIADYSEAIRLQPKNAKYFNERGLTWVEKKDYSKAILDYSQAIVLSEDPVYYHNRGTAWGMIKEYQKCIADFEEALRRSPKSSPDMEVLALLLCTIPDDEVRNGKRALQIAKLAHQNNPASVDALEIIAAAYAEIGDFASAKTWQQKAIDHPQLKDAGGAAFRMTLYQNGQPFRHSGPIVTVLPAASK